jgi:organic radical activating enzyme
MTSIREAFRKYFTPHKPMPAGTYHYQAPPDAALPHRLHLRMEPDGTGLLIVNASTVLHLNKTAAEYAFHLIHQTDEEDVAKLISARYKVSKEQASQDYRAFVDRIKTLIETPDLDPTTYLDFDRYTPYSQEISAPYRLDCALTYRLSPGSDPSFAPTDRVKRELTVDEWKTILEKAWKAGIPHVVFTGGEPTLYEGLAELITYAEKLGQVTGLITDGKRLSERASFYELLQTGLDHLTLLFQPDQEPDWELLKDLIAADLSVIVHLTITPQNIQEMLSLLERLAEMRVVTISLSASDPSLADALQAIRQRAAGLDISLVWDLPVPYSFFHPIALELAEQTQAVEQLPTGAGKAWLYVEPDGDVLPAQDVNRVLGNFLTDPWEAIWGK